jgi:hypothetical protein
MYHGDVCDSSLQTGIFVIVVCFIIMTFSVIFVSSIPVMTALDVCEAWKARVQRCVASDGSCVNPLKTKRICFV